MYHDLFSGPGGLRAAPRCANARECSGKGLPVRARRPAGRCVAQAARLAMRALTDRRRQRKTEVRNSLGPRKCFRRNSPSSGTTLEWRAGRSIRARSARHPDRDNAALGHHRFRRTVRAGARRRPIIASAERRAAPPPAACENQPRALDDPHRPENRTPRRPAPAGISRGPCTTCTGRRNQPRALDHLPPPKTTCTGRLHHLHRPPTPPAPSPSSRATRAP
jgi:hypothetical protein